MISSVKGNGHFIARIEVNQFGATFMGVTLALATSVVNDWLFLIASIFTTIFYLSLLYTAFWDLGAQEAVRIQGGRAVSRPLTGLWLSLVANLPNILLAVLVLVGGLFAGESVVGETVVHNAAAQLHDVCAVIFRVWNAMYWGIFRSLHYLDILYLFSVLPALAASSLGYLAGLRNFHLLEFLHLASKKDEKKESKRPETRL